jgi:hypothetical protein
MKHRITRIDEFGQYRSPNLAFLVATAFTDNMTLLTNNSGGAVQQLPFTNVIGGRGRGQFGRIALAAQASGTVIHIARIPLSACLASIWAKTDTSLGTATISFGDVNNQVLYGAAATLTTVNGRTDFLPASQFGVPILTGWDAVTGNQCTYAQPGQGGANYEDIVMTTGAAGLPASGNLVTYVEYQID